MNIPKIIRNIAGFLLALCCATLIMFFGILPLCQYSACPILKEKSNSIYGKGSLAFVHEVSPSDLSNGDIAVYYSGDTPIGAEVRSNDKVNATLLLSANDSSGYVSYRKISGKGTRFSIPFMGRYADWLTNGTGVRVTVIIMGVMFVIFALSAFIMRDESE